MPDQRQIQTNFTSGEISPRVYGRVEHERYQNGAARLENVVISPTGGAIKRNGTTAIGSLDASAYAGIIGDAGYQGATNSKVQGVRLVPFVFNRESSYVVAFLAKSLTSCEVIIISNSTKDFHRFTATDQANHPSGTVSANDIVKVWDLNATSFDIPYLPTDLDKLDVAQVEDTIFITHPSHPVRKLVRSLNSNDEDTYWTIENAIFYDGPYDPLNTDESNPLSFELSVDHTEVSFTNSADMTALATDDFIEFESSGDNIFGKIISIDTNNQKAKVVSVDNILKELDTSVVVESSSAHMKYLGSDNITPHSGGQGFKGFLLATSTIFSKSHEGAYYKHRQWDPQSQDIVNRWVKIDEYLGLRVVKPNQTGTNAEQTNPKLRSWAPSRDPWVSGSTAAWPAGTTTADDDEHSDIPTGGITADCVRLAAGFWRHPNAPTSNSDFHFENTEPQGKVYQTDRIIFGKVKSNNPVFDPALDAGRFIRFDFGGKKVWGVLSTGQDAAAEGVGGAFWDSNTQNYVANTTTEFIVRLYVPMPLDPNGRGRVMDNGVTTNWQLGAWRSGNYPKSCSFFQQRMVFGGSPNRPQTLWFSTLGDYETFSPTEIDSTVLPTSGFSYKISSTNTNEILWMDSAENLIIGTSGSEWRVTSSSSGTAITPTNVKITQQTTFGSSDIRPQRVGDSVIFTQAPGKIVRELSYNYDTDSLRAINISVLADHLFDINSPIAETSYLKYPHSQLFFKTGAGDLYYMTYEKEQKVVAFSRYFFGGYSRKSVNVQAHWVTQTQYDSGDQVLIDGIVYECDISHLSSSSFEKDYTEGRWTSLGPSVLGVCSLPSSTDLKSDSLFIATYRRGFDVDSSGLPALDNGNESLCFEYLSPLGDFSVDKPHQQKLGHLVRGMDFSFSPSSTQTVTAGDSLASLVVTDYIDKIPFSLTNNGSNKINVSLVIYGGDSDPYVYESYPNSNFPTCELVGAGTNTWAVRVRDVNGQISNIYTNDTAGHLEINWTIGFPFNALIETLPLESSGGGGTSTGRIKRINEVTLNLDSTGEFRLGSDSMQNILIGETSFTGQITTSINDEYSEQSRIIINSPYPSSLGLLSYSPELTINR